jgi:ATP-dependent DNA helicase DinG
LPSPFDFAEQAALYLPIELPDPREPSFSEVARDHIVQLTTLTDGGAFVLCTSLRSMHTLSKLCRPSLPQLTLMTQGDAPNNVLLDRFRENGRAVLFATASFWQGVDVPGHALRLVIIDKLPFDVPTDPLIQARCDRLKAQGIEPFMKYLVPSAALTLKQGFGRLIRTRDDRGIVAILDRRLTTKGYGKVFLRSLPDASRCGSFAEVEAFWRAGAPRGPEAIE